MIRHRSSQNRRQQEPTGKIMQVGRRQQELTGKIMQARLQSILLFPVPSPKEDRRAGMLLSQRASRRSRRPMMPIHERIRPLQLQFRPSLHAKIKRQPLPCPQSRSDWLKDPVCPQCPTNLFRSRLSYPCLRDPRSRRSPWYRHNHQHSHQRCLRLLSHQRSRWSHRLRRRLLRPGRPLRYRRHQAGAWYRCNSTI